jgi:uncharacterized protein YprB with RNaseH-like and TPR domain
MMLNATTYQRLEALRRGAPTPIVADQRQRPPLHPIAAALPEERTAANEAPPVDWFESGETIGNASGEHYQILLPVDRFWSADRRPPSSVERPPDQRRAAGPPLELRALAANLPDRVLLLDLETCGFAGSAIFLIGLLRQIDGGLWVELLLARNYAEERAILESFWSRIGDHRVLVTFNGKSFDWPMIRDRSIRHHLKGPHRQPLLTDRAPGNGAHRPRHHDRSPPLVHCDLLHHARRKWRKRLPDCRLQTLERAICGRNRQGDIPGGKIPDVYHRFVRTGQRGQIRSVLHHNAVDLITLLDLAQRLSQDVPHGFEP